MALESSQPSRRVESPTWNKTAETGVGHLAENIESERKGKLEAIAKKYNMGYEDLASLSYREVEHEAQPDLPSTVKGGISYKGGPAWTAVDSSGRINGGKFYTDFYDVADGGRKFVSYDTRRFEGEDAAKMVAHVKAAVEERDKVNDAAFGKFVAGVDNEDAFRHELFDKFFGQTAEEKQAEAA